MTIYYAVDPYYENFRVNLRSEIYEEAVQEMEQMAGMELRVEEPEQPYEHLCTLSFSVTTNHTEGDIPEDSIRSALIQRLAYLDKWARWKDEIEVFETSGGDNKEE